MGLNIFGSGGGGGSAGAGALGGIGGFLSGGPIGGVAGLIGGLFGSGDQETTTSFNYSNLSEGMAGARDSAVSALQNLMGQMDPSVMNSFIEQLSGQMEGVARQDVGDTFTAQRGRQRADSARSGGTLGSVQNVYDAASGREESNALSQAVLGSRLSAEQIGQGRTQLAQSGAQVATGAISGIEGTRRLTSQTGVTQGNTMGDMLGGVMGALSDPMSAFNSGGLGGANGLAGSLGGGRYTDFINNILSPKKKKNRPGSNQGDY